ncbi:sodium:solute symporter family protein, partial [Rhizobium leguminosarum]|nr:sodium:solute symporter family protein [Rhizobium leguminosarum]
YGTMDLGKGINILRDFVAVVFTIPLLAGIMGLKTDAKSFFVSMLATFIAFCVGKLFLPDLWFMPMVIAVNSITFFAVHYIQNKGFVTVKRDTVVLS